MTRKGRAIRAFTILAVAGAFGIYANEKLRPLKPPPVDLTTVVLHEWDSGRTVPVFSSQTVRIELDSNPSTGYHWRLAEGNATALAPVRSSDNPQHMPGGDTYIQPFRVPYSAVPTTVKIVLVRPMTDQPPVETFSVKLTRAPAR